MDLVPGIVTLDPWAGHNAKWGAMRELPHSVQENVCSPSSYLHSSFQGFLHVGCRTSFTKEEYRIARVLDEEVPGGDESSE